MKRILFISHDASLTGAPVVLLNLIKCLKNAGYICDRIIIKRKSGLLIEEFERIAEVIFFYDLTKNHHGVFKRIKNNFTIIKEKRKQRTIQEWINEAEIVFSNTITNGSILNKFNFTNKQIIISYIHELQMATDVFTNKVDLDAVLKKTSIFCAQSHVIKNFLRNNYCVHTNRIKKLNYLVPLSINKVQKETTQSSKFTVGMMGTLDWRKGAEIIAVIIVDFFNKFPHADLEFLWKGGNKGSSEYFQIEYELKKSGHLNKISFEEPDREIDTFYNTIDLLLLCSIEDPYPLVVLHAASFKKPCICFENAGGAPEFVKNDAGSTVPYLNVNSVTNSIFNYYSDKEMCIGKGNVAYQRYMEQHNNEKLVLQQFKELLLPDINE